ncbi:polysaccharide deacetylase family protein [Guptibacillus hwajinpoensis]|uniref:polysaccharide deacetylase family protein n=1 Tax=Guptibacillus hwajinpoensis TaxID=208199 RepID=UPI001CFD822C|nr:polysaccharide deacetylase family protein [Pseudalkalibacillus hwajinpoensis]WLR61452.1 polysaccharide deacetylase family protein [Pseudalkalibacillus hwajinpoensis]
MYDSIDQNVITSGEKGANKTVILTFDDGPGRVLPKLLDILKKEEVQAMFFWQSRLLYKERPWKRVLDEGHLIGTHSCKHPNLTKLSYAEQFEELEYSKLKIHEITGSPVTYFRPPFGQYNLETIKAAQDLGLTTVMWRISSMDWELARHPEEILQNVIQNLENGAIILLHELQQTIQVLPDLIKKIRAEGYDFSLLPPLEK